MSGQLDATPEARSAGWRQRLAAPGLAILAVLCCLGAPLIVGAVGALSAGALFGLVAGAVALLTLCLWAARRLTSGRC